jgi:hypothetical protein
MRFAHLGGLAVWIACGALAPSAGAAAQFVIHGYWMRYLPESDYEGYLRITADSGFYCVLDGKSSFAFAIRKDSITTPLNGMNAIAWMPGSGDIVITGSEKGQPYSNRFKESDSATYWSKCRSEEQAGKPTPLRGAARPAAGLRGTEGGKIYRTGFVWNRKAFTVSGRARPGR